LKIIDWYALLRLFGVASKFISILCIPVVFEVSEIALFSIVLAAERFVSFVCSMEAHSYFNRRLIHRNCSIEYVNNQHIPIFIVGVFLSFFVGVFYVWKMGINNLYVYIMVLGIIGSVQNEMIRRAQAVSKIDVFSILSALKSSSLALAIVAIVVIDINDFIIFLKIFSFFSLVICLVGVIGYSELCVFSIRAVSKRLKSTQYLTAGASVLNKFVIQGGSIFGLAILERSLILNTYKDSDLAAHYSIQSIALAALVLMDIFYWGPNYSKFISAFRMPEMTILKVIASYKKQILFFQSFIVSSFLISAFFLAIISDNWNMIISENFFWIGINVLLIIIIPIDIILTYFVHARQRDIVNAQAGITGLLAMTAFFLVEFDSLYIPFGIVIFYVVSLSIKLFSGTRLSTVYS